MGDQPNARPLPTQDNTTPKDAAMPRVGFEPTFPVFERSKTVRALDSAAIGTGFPIRRNTKINTHMSTCVEKFHIQNSLPAFFNKDDV
jgi:hypothetical protein